MSKNGGQFAFMEMIALISAICIVGLFLFAQYDRQSQQYDLVASEASQKVQSALDAYFTANPEATLTAESLAGVEGLKLTPPLKLELVRGADKADNWRVRLWHPEGQLVFLVSHKGITQKHR